MIKSRRMRWVGMWHAWETWEMHKEFSSEELKGNTTLTAKA
jgi:hypothetical protein